MAGGDGPQQLGPVVALARLDVGELSDDLPPAAQELGHAGALGGQAQARDHLISLIGSFSERGIIFKALDLGIDSATPSGKLVIGIFAALAEYDGAGRPAGNDPGKDPRWPVVGQGSGQAHRTTLRHKSGEFPEG